MEYISISCTIKPYTTLILRYKQDASGKSRKLIIPIRDNLNEVNKLTELADKLASKYSHLKNVEYSKIIQILEILKQNISKEKEENEIKPESKKEKKVWFKEEEEHFNLSDHENDIDDNEYIETYEENEDFVF